MVWLAELGCCVSVKFNWVDANDSCRALHQFISRDLRANCFAYAYVAAHGYGVRRLQVISQNSVACNNSHASPSASVLGCATLHVDPASCTTVCVRLSIPSRTLPVVSVKNWAIDWSMLVPSPPPKQRPEVVHGKNFPS